MTANEEDTLLLTLITRLDSIDRRLDSIEKLGTLVEAALGAVAIQSQNAHKIADLEARVGILERKPLVA